MNPNLDTDKKQDSYVGGYRWQSDEFQLSGMLLLLHVFSIGIFIFEKTHWNFFFISQALFVLVGIQIWRKQKAYVPSGNRYSASYVIIEGEQAKQLGIFFICLAFITAIVLNAVNLWNDSYIADVFFAQLAISVLVTVLTAIQFGKKVERMVSL